jgi:hypothetical protein
MNFIAWLLQESFGLYFEEHKKKLSRWHTHIFLFVQMVSSLVLLLTVIDIYFRALLWRSINLAAPALLYLLTINREKRINKIITVVGFIKNDNRIYSCNM